MVDTALEETAAPGVVRRGHWRRAGARFGRQRTALAALALLVILFGAGALAGVLAPYSFSAINVDLPSRPPSLHHLFGTDLIGRDHFSRTLYAIRTSETVALAVAGAATLIGIVIGALAGYYGGWPDAPRTRGSSSSICSRTRSARSSPPRRCSSARRSCSTRRSSSSTTATTRA